MKEAAEDCNEDCSDHRGEGRDGDCALSPGENSVLHARALWNAACHEPTPRSLARSASISALGTWISFLAKLAKRVNSSSGRTASSGQGAQSVSPFFSGLSTQTTGNLCPFSTPLRARVWCSWPKASVIITGVPAAIRSEE